MHVSIASLNLVLDTQLSNNIVGFNNAIATTHFGAHEVKIMINSDRNRIVSIGRHAILELPESGKLIAMNKHGAIADVTSNNNSLILASAGFQMVFNFVQPTAIVSHSTCISVETLRIGTRMTSRQCSYGANAKLLSKVLSWRTGKNPIGKFINVYHDNGHVAKQTAIKARTIKVFPKIATHPGRIFDKYNHVGALICCQWMTGSQSAPIFVEKHEDGAENDQGTAGIKFQFASHVVRILKEGENLIRFGVDKKFYFNCVTTAGIPAQPHHHIRAWNESTKAYDVEIKQIAPNTYRAVYKGKDDDRAHTYTYRLDLLNPSMQQS